MGNDMGEPGQADDSQMDDDQEIVEPYDYQDDEEEGNEPHEQEGEPGHQGEED